MIRMKAVNSIHTILVLAIVSLLTAVSCAGDPQSTPVAPTAMQSPTPTPSPPTATPAPTPQEIVEELISVWLEDNPDVLTIEILDFLTAEVPLAGPFADTVLKAQVLENLALVFSVPSQIGDDLYRTVVTTETDVEFDVPLIGKRAYKIALPFNVDVDIKSKELADWSADISLATVEETEPSS